MGTSSPSSSYTFRARDLTWLAPSDTRPGTVYTVTASAFDAELRCSCPARAVCKHIRRALAGEYGKPRCKVTQQPRGIPSHPAPVLRVPAGAGFGFQAPEGL